VTASVIHHSRSPITSGPGDNDIICRRAYGFFLQLNVNNVSVACVPLSCYVWYEDSGGIQSVLKFALSSYTVALHRSLRAVITL